jgi:hypothetical protein
MNKKARYGAFVAGIAVLGGGAYAITGQLTDNDSATTDTALPAATPSVVVSSSPPAEPKKAEPEPSSPLAGPTINLGKEAMERLAAAKEAGEDDIKAQRALPPSGPLVTGPVEVKEEGSIRETGKMLRVVSAQQDLTGYQELAWVAGEGERFGSSTCTQKIKMSNEAEARPRPTLLICWRVSPNQSVYTLMVDVKKKPSKQESVAKIDEVWARMN